MIQFNKPELQTRILLVENNPNMAKIIREMLFSLGFRDQQRVTNVVHAYQALASYRPGLIIAEVSIEPSGGAKFCKALRIAADSPDRNCLILLTLAEATPRAVTEARDAGAHFLIAKPLSQAGLATKIAALLRNPPPLVTSDTYTGPDRRRKAVPLSGPERRKKPWSTADYQQPAYAVMEVDAEILSGAKPPPQDMVVDDNQRQLRSLARPAGPGRKIMISQLEHGMELAEAVRGADRAVLVPSGVVATGVMIAGLKRLVEQGKIAPLVRVVG